MTTSMDEIARPSENVAHAYPVQEIFLSSLAGRDDLAASGAAFAAPLP
jgi:hypothetical protein